MHQILKRLELIKTAITIEDEEIIELQVMKLNATACDSEVKEILAQIKSSNYGDVALLIESYITKYSGVVVYEDKELQGLKLELKILENKLQELSQERDEYSNELHEFNTQYTLKLGELIRNILNLRKEILYKQTIKKEQKYQKTKAEYEELKSQKEKLEESLDGLDEFDDAYDEIYEELQELNTKLNEKRKQTKKEKEEIKEDPKYQEYTQSKEEYEEFSNDYEEIKNEKRFEIDEDEKKELKKLYKKAGKLCHPDIVVDELKEQATEIMKELNNAYATKNLSKVKEILNALESGIVFVVASDSIDDKDLLKEKIVELRKNIGITEDEIAEIKEDDAFETIHDMDSWDNYFNDLETTLQAELEKLKNDLKETDKPEVKQTNHLDNMYENVDIGNDDSDDYWESNF